MLSTRTLAWTLLAAAAVGMVTRTTTAQDDVPLSNVAREVANTYKNADRKLDPGELAKARQSLDDLAKFFVGRVSSPKLYKSIQEFKGGENPIDQLFKDLDRFMIVPQPGTSTRYIPENANYIRDFGQAFDAATKAAVTGSTDPIVRLNAARLLAQVARGGAAVHVKTITELLDNPATQPDVRLYALKAAEHFFAAYDPVNLFKQLDVRKHTVPDADLAPLIAAVEANITDTRLLLNLPKDADLKQLPEDQAAVAHYVRRQAVRALGQLRFVTFTDRAGQLLTPSYTLTRVATGDPAFDPPPSHTEAAEAVIGLGNMALVGEYQLPVAADAAATGIINFTKAGVATDKTTPWKLYAARISASLANWKSITKDLAKTRNPQVIADLAAVADKEVLSTLVSSGGTAAARPNLPEFERWRDDLRKKNASDKRTSLFFDKPATALKLGGP